MVSLKITMPIHSGFCLGVDLSPFAAESCQFHCKFAVSPGGTTIPAVNHSRFKRLEDSVIWLKFCLIWSILALGRGGKRRPA